MSVVRVQTDATERIQLTALDDSLDPVTGVTDLLLSIVRVSDDFLFDFNDSTFKSTGWTTREQAMSELDATNLPGEYYYDWNMSLITNQTADDSYHIYVRQSPGTTVVNVPQTGEIKEGQFVDHLDADVSSRAAPGDQMNLSDDAITSAKYDESTAYPLASADTGATQVARAGSDGDDLKDISDQIDTLPTAASITADVWSEGLPGAYGVGEAGKLVGDSLDAAVSSRATQADILNDATPFAGANVDAAITSRASQTSLNSLVEAMISAELVVAAGSSTTNVRTNATQANDFYNDMMLVVVNAAGTAARFIDDYNQTNGEFIVSPALPFTPSTSDRAVVLPTEFQSTSPSSIAAAVWSELLPGSYGVGEAGRIVGDNLDAAVSTRAIPGSEMNLSDDAITSAKYDESTAYPLAAVDSGATQVARAGADGDTLKTLSDQIDGLPSVAGITTGIWSENLPGTYGVGEAGRIIGDNLDQALSTTESNIRGADGDSLKNISDEIAALNNLSQADVQAAMTAQGYTAGRAPNLDNLDTTVSSRAAPGAQMDLVNDAVDSASLATTAVQEIRDSILADSIPFNGANIDAAISSVTDRLDELHVSEETTVSVGSTSSEIRTSLTQADDFFNDMVVFVVNSAGIAARRIDDFQNVNGAIIPDTALPFTPTPGDKVFILSRTAAAAATGGYTAADRTRDDQIAVETAAMDGRLPSDPADQSAVEAAISASETNVLAAISALNDLSIADVQTALDNQGYTAVRAALLDNLDDTISNVRADIAALNDLSQADVQAAMTAQGYTTVRAALLDNLDAAISTVSAKADIAKALVHDNGIMVNQQFNYTYQGKKYLTDADVWAYDSRTNAEAGGATGRIYQFVIHAEYTNGEQTLFRIVRVGS